MNEPCSGSWSEAPPTATPISPGSTTRVRSRPVKAVRSACSRKVTRRASPGSSGTRTKPCVGVACARQHARDLVRTETEGCPTVAELDRPPERASRPSADPERHPRLHAAWVDDQVGVGEAGVGQAVAEGEQRRRIHRTARVPRGQPRAQVRGRLPARRGRQLDREPAAGHQPPGQHPGDGAAALLAREERLHYPGQLAGRRADRVRPPGDQHQHHRGARGNHDPQQVFLHAGQPQVGHVAALARGAAAEQASLVAEHGHHHVRFPRVRGGVREPGAVRFADGAAGGVVDLRAGKFGPQRGEDGGGRRPFSRLRVPSAEVAGHAVAPVEGQRVVSQRPGHRDPGVPVQRQGGVPVGQQHHGFLGQPPGQRAVPGRVEVDALAVGSVRGPGLQAGPAGIEQAQVALLAQHPGRGAVRELLGHQAVAHRAGQRGTVAGDAGQFDVQARLQGQRGGLRWRRGYRVLRLQERDRVVVRDDQAVEAQRVPQQTGQQLAVTRYGDPVDVGVGRHDRPRPAAQRHLERHQDHVGELAAADGHRGHVAPGPGGRVPGEVLQRGVDPGRLQAADVRRADRADQVGVLADGLLGPPPARVPGHVEHGRQALVDADRSHAGADGRGHLADQPGVE